MLGEGKDTGKTGGETTFDEVVLSSRNVFILETKIELVLKIEEALKQVIASGCKISIMKDGKAVETQIAEVSLERLIAGAEMLLSIYKQRLAAELSALKAGYKTSVNPADETTKTDGKVLLTDSIELNRALEVCKEVKRNCKRYSSNRIKKCSSIC